MLASIDSPDSNVTRVEERSTRTTVSSVKPSMRKGKYHSDAISDGRVGVRWTFFAIGSKVNEIALPAPGCLDNCWSTATAAFHGKNIIAATTRIHATAVASRAADVFRRKYCR